MWALLRLQASILGPQGSYNRANPSFTLSCKEGDAWVEAGEEPGELPRGLEQKGAGDHLRAQLPPSDTRAGMEVEGASGRQMATQTVLEPGLRILAGYWKPRPPPPTAPPDQDRSSWDAGKASSMGEKDWLTPTTLASSHQWKQGTPWTMPPPLPWRPLLHWSRQVGQRRAGPGRGDDGLPQRAAWQCGRASCLHRAQDEGRRHGHRHCLHLPPSEAARGS